MSDDLDDQLRGALRAVDPGEQFAQRVLSRVTNEPRHATRSIPTGLRWLSAGLAASLLLSILVVHESRARHEQQGLDARNQLIEALRVTGEKLDLAYRVVNDSASG
jgi:hypothetical protein